MQKYLKVTIFNLLHPILGSLKTNLANIERESNFQQRFFYVHTFFGIVLNLLENVKNVGGGGGRGGSLNYFGKHGKAIKFSFNPPLILHTEIN